MDHRDTRINCPEEKEITEQLTLRNQLIRENQDLNDDMIYYTDYQEGEVYTRAEERYEYNEWFIERINGKLGIREGDDSIMTLQDLQASGSRP